MHQFLNVEGSESGEEEEEADGECSVATARYDEGLACGADVRGVLIPEADEQEAAESNAFPSEIKKQQIVAEYEREHGGDEEVHVGEEARVASVVAHVFRGVEMDEEADEC